MKYAITNNALARKHSTLATSDSNAESFDLAKVDGAAAQASSIGKTLGGHVVEFSVVIPLYNKRNSIVRTLRSVFAQTLPAVQVIVVDDGSDDGGIELVENEFGSRVHVVRQANAGVSAARNTGIAHASEGFIAFLDADDFWAPHFLEELSVLHGMCPGAGMLATGYQYYQGSDRYLCPKIRRLGRNLNRSHAINYFAVAAAGDLPFTASSIAIDSNLLRELGAFPAGEGMGEDQCMWSRVALHATIAYSPRSLSFYNRSAENRACELAPPQHECPFSRRLNTYVENVKIEDSLRKHIIEYCAAHLIQLADRNTAAGNYTTAHELLADPRCWKKPLKKLRSIARLGYAKITFLIKQSWFAYRDVPLIKHVSGAENLMSRRAKPADIR